MDQSRNYFSMISKDEKDLMNNTKNFTMRHRLNREIDFTDDFRKKYMTKEYGNYDKYLKNSIETVYDEGKEEGTHDKMYANYINLIKRLPTKEADQMKEEKKESITELLKDDFRGHQEFPDKFMAWKS